MTKMEPKWSSKLVVASKRGLLGIRVKVPLGHRPRFRGRRRIRKPLRIAVDNANAATASNELSMHAAHAADQPREVIRATEACSWSCFAVVRPAQAEAIANAKSKIVKTVRGLMSAPEVRVSTHQKHMNGMGKTQAGGGC